MTAATPPPKYQIVLRKGLKGLKAPPSELAPMYARIASKAKGRTAVLDPVLVKCAFGVGKGLMMFVECILDEFDKSELPFTRTAILAALLDAAAQMNHPFADDLAMIDDLATLCDILHRRRLRRLAN